MKDANYIKLYRNDMHNFKLMNDIVSDYNKFNDKANYKFRDLRDVSDFEAFYRLFYNKQIEINLYTYIDWRLRLAKNPDEKSKSGAV